MSKSRNNHYSKWNNHYSKWVNSPHLHNSPPSFESLATTFFKVADARLSPTQKQLLCECARVLLYHKLAVTALADLVSQRTDVPYSTVKWNLRSLMDMGLLEGGNSEKRGRYAKLTSSAEMLVRYLSKAGECT